MAEGRGAPLKNRQIQRLAASISRHDMESIAMGYLNISHEKIKSSKGEETEAFNRDMIVLWANRNAKDQVMVSDIHFISCKMRCRKDNRRMK